MKKLKIILSVAILSLLATGCTSAKEAATEAVVETTSETTNETVEETATTTDTGNTRFEDYELTDKAKAELEDVFKNCFYFQIGDSQVQSFSELSNEQISDILLTTIGLSGSPLEKTAGKEGNQNLVNKEDASTYLKAFGIDIGNVNFAYEKYPRIKDNGDTLIMGVGDYGSATPYADINQVVLDKENNIITIKGDALFVDYGTIDVYNFTATMQPSDTSYFDGNMLLTLTYIKDNSGNYSRIDTSRFGEGFYKVQ